MWGEVEDVGSGGGCGMWWKMWEDGTWNGCSVEGLVCVVSLKWVHEYK